MRLVSRVRLASLLAVASMIVPASASAQVSPPAAKPLFPEGQCSGVLCSTIGGPQAPQAQRSLFPQGECGGVLCSVIGGSQAPKPVGPPPPCGGGLLCDIAPYSVGAPLGAAAQAQPVLPPTPETAAPIKSTKKHRRAMKSREKAQAAR